MRACADSRSVEPNGHAPASSPAIQPGALEIFAYGWWTFGGGIQADQRLEGQLTKCRWRGIVFYVREILDNQFSFYLSSGERMQEKGGNRGNRRPDPRRQVLDLCTVKEEDRELTAQVVRSLDPLRQPVRRHRRFTAKWAERQLRQSRRL